MAKKLPTDGYILGLDVGERKIGVAISSAIARLPEPQELIMVSDGVFDVIREVIVKNDIRLVVVGLPRNLNGEETAQSRSIRQFVDEFKKHQSDVPVVFADETLSSVRADDVAKTAQFKGVARDSLAACFILEEYFELARNYK